MSSSRADRAPRPPTRPPVRPPVRTGSRRPRRPSAEHQAAVARRLDLLRAELNGTAPGAPSLTVVPPLADGGPGAGRWDVGPGAIDDEPLDDEQHDVELGDAELDDDELGDAELDDDGPHDAPGQDPGDVWWADATRLPGRAPVPAVRWAEDATPDELSAGAPVPGRHASRRRLELLAGLVPEAVRGRVSIGNGQLTVVALLLCIGLLVTSWVVVRARPQPMAPVSAPVTAADAASTLGAGVVGQPVDVSAVVALPTEPSGSPDQPAAAASGTVTVDVAGKVRHPGIAVLDAGARVVDAIRSAGGAKDGVDLTSLNLARPLVDGEQVLVGVEPPAGVAAAALAGPAAGGASGSAATGTQGALVNLNTATEAELDTLPDVGPVTAQSIIAWREQHGGYTTVDELLEVDGIGEATLTRLAPHVTV